MLLRIPVRFVVALLMSMVFVGEWSRSSLFASSISASSFAVSPSPLVLQDGDETQDENSINEQTIYIPYDKLREVFEKDGRGVFLPYEKFQQLWDEARKRQPLPVETAAPLGALITDIDSVASLGKEIVIVDANIKIELLRKGWHRVPLRLADAAIRSAKIGDNEARVVAGEGGQYELLIENQGEISKTIELELSYAKSLRKTRGQSSVSFQSPQAPVNRWTIRSGQTDIEVEIEPMIASSKKEESDTDENAGDEILAFVGAAPQVLIRWTPKSEGASGLAALISAQNQQQVQIDEGVARTSANIRLDISRAEVTQIKLQVPLDQKVVNVFDRNVKKWDVEQADATQLVTIELFEPALGTQNISLELEKYVEDTDAESLSVSQVEVLDASRNQGIVLVKLAAGLRAEPKEKKGLLQLDKSELPAATAKQNWNFAYRYASLPFDLSLDVKKIQPLINVTQLIEIAIRPQQMTADLSMTFDIQQAGVFQLMLDIPDEFEIRDVRPLADKGLAGAPVDTFYRDPESDARWIVTLTRKAIGKVGLAVSLSRVLDDPNLLSPTDETSDLAISVPKASIDGIEFSNGTMIIYAPESLQLNSSETKGLRNDSFANALTGFNSVVSGTTQVKPVLAYSFAHSDASLTIQAKRRRPQVTVNQLLVVGIESGVVKYEATFFYDVMYSGVKSLRLDVPTELVGQLRNRSSDIIQQTIEPAPEDIEEGYTAWKLTSENEFFGNKEIRFTWEEKAAELPLGQSRDVNVARLMPMDVDRATGQIVTKKSETIDVRPAESANGLRPIDPQTDLHAGKVVESAAMAFEFIDDWTLSLTATRYELEDLKRTSISRAVVRVVALRQDQLSVQALYQVRSVDQRLAVRMPKGFDPSTSFDDQPVRVNGNRVTPERGGEDLIYVPLTEQNSSQTFLLELRYTVEGSHRQIDLPEFPDDPAVQKVFLCVYLPFEQALLSKSGPWTDEAIDVDTNFFSRIFNRREEKVQAHMNWVRQGVPGDTNTAQAFQTDGRPYVFSTLRPEAAPEGSLSLRTINQTLLNAIVCCLIFLVGLLLVKCRLTIQLAALVLILASVVVVAIFYPLITEHLFGPAFWLAIGVVAIVWLVVNGGKWSRAVAAERREHRQRRELAAATASSSTTPFVISDSDRAETSKSSDSGSDSSSPGKASSEKGTAAESGKPSSGDKKDSDDSA